MPDSWSTVRSPAGAGGIAPSGADAPDGGGQALASADRVSGGPAVVEASGLLPVSASITMIATPAASTASAPPPNIIMVRLRVSADRCQGGGSSTFGTSI